MHTFTKLYLHVFTDVSGGRRFIKDIEMMIGTKSVWFWLYWKLCWYFITPCVTLVSALLNTVENYPKPWKHRILCAPIVRQMN